MNNAILTLFLIAIFGSSCQKNVPLKTDIVPLPKELTAEKGSYTIDTSTQIVIADAEFEPLGKLLNLQLKKYNGVQLEIISEATEKNHIAFIVDPALKEEAYELAISDHVEIKASDYNGMALALASLTQLIQPQGEKLMLPKLKITDSPDYGYRAAMLDVARFWHPVETLKETIDLMWLYKIKYLGLHLADNRRFTFPLEGFPKLQTVQEDGSPFYYTREELDDVVEYAKQRGIAIIPEIDLPGHSRQLWTKYPETFGSIDKNTGEPKELYVVNMAKESTYEASAKIIEQLAEVFYTSPFINIGGDEVYLEAIKALPEYASYCNANDLNAAAGGNADELFCYFINRMHEAVKKTGKKTIIWEGFPDSGAGEVTISKDITVIVWNTTYNHPENLVANGYNIINSTWIPWYMVGAMNLAPTAKKGYDWDVTDWSHWNDDIADVKLEPNDVTKGGQLSFWEQNYYKVIPVMRERLPVLAERLWSNSAPSDFEGFNKRLASSDSVYGTLFRPIEMVTKGLLQEQDLTFEDEALVTLSTSSAGNIKYAFSENWGIPAMHKATVYSKPIPITDSGVVTAQLFDASGKAIGFPQQSYYQKIAPAYTYKVYGLAPNKGWKTLPDFESLDMIREGVSGKITEKRLEKIDGELFAKVKREGHIEIRFNGLYNPYAVELKGAMAIESEGPYTFRLQTHDGLAELYIDGEPAALGKEFKNEPEDFEIELSEGTHDFTIRYYYKEIQNQLSLLYKTLEMDEFVPFENLVQSLK